MEWRITKTNSGYHAQYGGYVEAGTLAGFCIGFIMPGFKERSQYNGLENR